VTTGRPLEKRKARAVRLAYFCFVAAALSALTGMSLGILMGMHEDFTLAPAHAHINRLGWVTLALYGLYHRGVERASNRLAWVQAGAGALGAPLLSGGFAAVLATGTHAPAFIVAGSAGTLLVLLGMLLFVAVLVADLIARRARPRVSGPVPA
jgi:hypothetical protein